MIEVLPGPIGTMSRAIAERLKAVMPPEQFGHQWLSAKLDKSVWEQIIRRCPSVSLEYLGYTRIENTSALTGKALWRIWVTVMNSRSAEALLLGDGRAAGAMQLHQVAMVALHGMTVKGAGTLLVAQAEPVAFEGREDPGIFVVAITVNVEKMNISADEVLSGDILNSGTLLRNDIDWIFGDGTVVAQSDFETTGTT